MTDTNHDRCRVCGGPSRFAFRQRLLAHDVSYFDCGTCGYFQTESPYWLSEAYASAINEFDTGIIWRNQFNVRRVGMTMAACGRLHGRVVDHAGGYGILVRMLRDAGIDAQWRDKYCENLLARGFEASGQAIDLVTAFEVFEHFEDPLSELRTMLEDAPMVLLSTELIASAETPHPDWWYLGPEHGQHIGFFRAATLHWMSTQLGCHYASDGRSVHLFSRDAVPGSWRLALKLQRLWPLIARLRLTSKTISDFEVLRRTSH